MPAEPDAPNTVIVEGLCYPHVRCSRTHIVWSMRYAPPFPISMIHKLCPTLGFHLNSTPEYERIVSAFRLLVIPISI